LIICGIDVGKTGALAFWEPRSDRLDICDVPVIEAGSGGKSVIDEDALWRILADRADYVTHAFVEIINAMPALARAPGGERRAMGTTSALNFGMTYGLIRMALAATRIPRSFVKPNIWKRALGVPAAKEGAIARADQLLPAHTKRWRGPRGGALDGRAEAALIACYGERVLTGV